MTKRTNNDAKLAALLIALAESKGYTITTKS
jgi:hypothetical protein